MTFGCHYSPRAPRLSQGRGERRSFRRDVSGAALVEFTLVFPLLLVFFAGLSELGFALHQQHIVQKAVRDAARYAARTNYDLKSCPLATQPEWTQMVTDTTTVALRGNLSSTAPLLLATWTGSRTVDVQVTEACVDPASVTPVIFSTAGAGNDIPVITVSASAPFAGIGLLQLIGLSAFEIQATHSEIWVGL